jgi:hypothetical protein
MAPGPEGETMFEHLGPSDSECDAPPYPIVQAAARIGIRSPEDVRWVRLSHHIPGSLASGLRKRSATGLTCSCGQPLRHLQHVTFTFNTGATMSYVMDQYCRCRTVFWEEE